MKSPLEFDASKSEFPVCIMKDKDGQMVFVTLDLSMPEVVSQFFDSYDRINENLYLTKNEPGTKDNPNQYVYINEDYAESSQRFTSEEEYTSEIKILKSWSGQKSFFRVSDGGTSSYFTSQDEIEGLYVLTDDQGHKELFSVDTFQSAKFFNVEEYSVQAHPEDENILIWSLKSGKVEFEKKFHIEDFRFID